MASDAVDETTLSTLSLLESRILRVEHLLHGQTGSPSLTQDEPAAVQMTSLERRFGSLVSRIRVYAELLKICTNHHNHNCSLADELTNHRQDSP